MHNWSSYWVSKFLSHLWWKRQISADSVGSGSNLNCSCLIVCTLFFPKIISRYINIYLIREIPKKFQDSTTSYEWSSLPFWPHFEMGIKKYVHLGMPKKIMHSMSCTRVHLGMANNVAKGSFHFLNAQNEFFCEETTKYLL